MKYALLTVATSIFFVGCAGVKVADTQIASGAANPRSIYIRPFNVAATEYKGSHRGGPGERPIRHSLAGREFAENLKLEMEKIAPAMVIENDERPPQGWLVEGSLDVVDGGSPKLRGLPGSSFGFGKSQVLIHVRIHDVAGVSVDGDKDSSKLTKRGNVIYEFDLSGGSHGTGRHGSIYAPGFGDAQPFDFKNAAERVMLALSNDPDHFGIRTAPVMH